MNLEELKKSGRIIFECVSGSHAYGTNTPQSDIDIRGFYINPCTEYLTLPDFKPSNQIGDEKHDITYYSLERAFHLLQGANPNMIELLWMPDECVNIMTPRMKELIKHRELFISKKCYHTHNGYAFSQIKKCQGQNKKVHNPQPKEMPKKEDFCWVIETWEGLLAAEMKGHIDVDKSVFPSRPKTLIESSVDLSRCHVASLEHAQNVFRLYDYGNEAKGVFRGDDMLVPESIPVEDEFTKFIGLLIYNKQEHEKALKDWHSYWDWMKNRNESRWIDQEKGKLNYDQKNLCHCVRLLMSGENILKNGEPIVRFKGDDLRYLRQIRAAELSYETIMADVEDRMKNLEELYKTSSIPHSVDREKVNEFYMELSGAKEIAKII